MRGFPEEKGTDSNARADEEREAEGGREGGSPAVAMAGEDQKPRATTKKKGLFGKVPGSTALKSPPTRPGGANLAVR